MKKKSYIKTQNINQMPLWEKRPPRLSRLDIELTERCNNNCIHCCINIPADDLEAKNRELSTEEIKDVLGQAVALDCMTVRFTGGEPLLRDDFEELYIFARKQGLKVILFTNATLITDRIVTLFKSIPPLEIIEVSLYGMKRESYEAISRVAGSFNSAWNGIQRLVKNNIPFIVKQPLLPQNTAEISEFEEWAATIPWMHKKPTYSLYLELRSRRDGAQNETIKRLRLTPDHGLAIQTRDKDFCIAGMKQFLPKFTRPGKDKLFTCGAGQAPCLGAYGFIHPCLSLKDPSCACDLRKCSLEDALTIHFPKVRNTKANNKDYLMRCANCFLKGLCEQCPAKAWSEHGSLDAVPEYYCDIAHAQARYLGLIGENEKAWTVRDWQERIDAFVGKK